MQRGTPSAGLHKLGRTTIASEAKKCERDRSSADHLLSEGCAAHSRNWEVRLEVMRPPSCRTTSGRTAGHTSSLSNRTWSK